MRPMDLPALPGRVVSILPPFNLRRVFLGGIALVLFVVIFVLSGEFFEQLDAEELNDSKLLVPARDDYVDPVGSVQTEYQGRWIAGFAPVGNTGLVVVVQQRYDEVLALDPSTFHNLIVWAAVVVLLAITIVALVLWRWTRRSTTANLAQ